MSLITDFPGKANTIGLINITRSILGEITGKRIN